MERNELHRYEIHDGTCIVFAKINSSLWWNVPGLIVVVLLFAYGSSLAMLMFVLLVGVLLGGLIPELRVLAVEDDAIVLVKKAWFRVPVTLRLPFQQVSKLIQGRFNSAYLQLHLRDGTTHDISFIGGRRTRRARFGVTVNRTAEPVPPDPCVNPQESATALARYLAKQDISVEPSKW